MYYVHSAADEISFSVHRMILDEKRKPFRAFAVTRGYQMQMSSALIVRDEIVLSREDEEDQERIQFVNDIAERIEQLRGEAIALEEARVGVHASTSEQITKQNMRTHMWEAPLPEYQQIVASEIVHDDIDVLDYLDKVKIASITAKEAKMMFHYLKSHRSELRDYGLSFEEVKRHINYALGRIDKPDIREWLVEIEYLR